MTRLLALRYLWIDSLCIIQDSHTDWETESARMSSVFENAQLVLSAVDCADSDQSLLLPREKKLKLEYTSAAGKKFKVHARPFLDHHPHIADKIPARPVGPLMTRAWALQEQALCVRIAHFTPTEILFECRTTVSCECRPTPKSHPTTPGILAKSLSAKKKTYLFQAWHHITNQYTLRNITHLRDRLPALSGVAAKFQNSTESAFIAGLWRDNLTADLLWSSRADLQHPHSAPRVNSYRAPSFCWSSVETQVQYEEADSDVESTSMIEILNAETTHGTLNPFGEVTDGYMSLHGAVVGGVLIAPDSYTFPYRLKIHGRLPIDVFPDSLLVEHKADSFESPYTVRRARTGEAYKPFTTPVACLALSSSSDQITSGIVLGLSSRVPGAYERLGLFMCAHEVFEDVRKSNIKIV